MPGESHREHEDHYDDELCARGVLHEVVVLGLFVEAWGQDEERGEERKAGEELREDDWAVVAAIGCNNLWRCAVEGLCD